MLEFHQIGSRNVSGLEAWHIVAHSSNDKYNNAVEWQYAAEEEGIVGPEYALFPGIHRS